MPTIVSIQVGLPRGHGVEAAAAPMDRPWTTGFYKEPVAGPVRVAPTNLAGDGQADLVNHGGIDKAVCVYPADHYGFWRAELGLSEFPAGAFGENLTIAGLEESAVCIGDVWEAGDVVFEVSQPREPCWKLARRWRVKDLVPRVERTGKTGWYFRVLREGTVVAGLPLTLADRPVPQWTIERANQVMHHLKADVALAEELAGVAPLSTGWKATLRLRIEKNIQPDAERRLKGPPENRT